MANVTMRELGRLMGVSAVTVSKALSGKSGVSEEMRRKIVKLAEDLGYVNPHAAHDNEARRLDVGILVPDQFFSAESYYATFYKYLVQALSDAGHYGLLELLGESDEKALVLPNLVRNRRVDALILLGQPSREYVRMIARQEVPVVFLDFYDEHAGADAVVGDNTYACYRLTTHLIKNGHTDIGFVGDVRATSSIMDRYLGFYRAMLSRELPIREEWVIPDRDASGELFKSALPLPEKLPTAFVCNCDIVACWLMEQLTGMGLRIPEDVSVVGFDDFTMGLTPVTPLTTFRMDCQAMASMAVKLVNERCASMQRSCGRMVVSGQLIHRDSVKTLSRPEEA